MTENTAANLPFPLAPSTPPAPQQLVLSGSTIVGLVRELAQSQFSGVLHCQTENFSKSVNFWQGQIASASSTLIDDRMGEVIYREGRISLDAFIDAAGQVTKTQRFGDLLIKNGLFTPVDLWEALSSQSEAILSSLTYYDSFKVTMTPKPEAPKLELSIEFRAQNTIELAFQERQLIRKFEALARLNPNLVLVKDANKLAQNDFQRDMIALIEEHKDFNTLVDSGSRLSTPYTIRALYYLFLGGIIEDRWKFLEAVLPQDLVRTSLQVTEDANFLFNELKNVASKENLTNFSDIVFHTNKMLEKQLGFGLYVSEEQGFLGRNIVCASALRLKVKLFSQEHFSTLWPSVFGNILQNTLYSGLLFVFFEIQNKKFNSPLLANVRKMIDQMRQDLMPTE